MSQLEEQEFLAARQHPTFDRLPVAGASVADLNPELVADFAKTVQQRDQRGLGQFAGEELLRRAGILTGDDVPTRAGLLALGIYPQQWFPGFVIQAAVERLPGDPLSVRARNHVIVSGPIPHMLDSIMDWAGRNLDTSIVDRPGGRVVDVHAYPLVAFRELVTNALLHRDLDEWSMGMPVQVRLRSDRLIIGNPGGLYGITVDRLGRVPVTSARNQWLVRICQYLRSPEYGDRVIEGLATGMPTIAHSLAEAGLPPARYDDAGIRFTAVLRQQSRNPDHPGAPGQTSVTAEADSPELQLTSHRARTTAAERIVEILQNGPLGLADLQSRLGLSPAGTSKALRKLRDAGIVQQLGGRGQTTIYRLAP